MSEYEHDEAIDMTSKISEENLADWPRFESLCYLVGYALIMEEATPEERERIYKLRQDHFVETDGAALKKISRKAWQSWVDAGRPRTS